MIIDKINELVFEKYYYYIFLIIGIAFAWFSWSVLSIENKIIGGIMASLFIGLGICMTRIEYKINSELKHSEREK